MKLLSLRTSQVTILILLVAAGLMEGGQWSVAYAVTGPNQALPTFYKPNRPPRLGFTSLNPYLDRVKPLAPIDTAGLTYNSGILIGAVDDRWVMGMTFNTHKDLWWLDGETTMTAPPGSFGSHVMLGFRDGIIKKIEVLTGKVVWSTRLDGFSESGFALSGTKIYVLTSSQVLHALDFQTGQILWVYDGGFPQGLSIRGRTKPLVHDGKVYIGVSTGEVHCVDGETGKLDWRHNPEFLEGQFHDFVGDLVVRDNGLIFTRYDGLVGSIDLKGPARNLLWRDVLPSLSSSLVRGNRIYLGGVNGDVLAKELGSKESQFVWRYSSGLAISSIVVSEDLVIAIGAKGRLSGLSANDGSLLWHDDLEGSLETLPLFIDRTLYFATGFKNLYGFHLSQGSQTSGDAQGD